ncbi:MAG: hypothetical protein ACQETN_10055 [Bacillota bacterium]
MNFTKVLATSLGTPNFIKAICELFFRPLFPIIFAILTEFFLIQAAAFGLKGFNAFDSTQPPERKVPRKSLTPPLE